MFNLITTYFAQSLILLKPHRSEGPITADYDSAETPTCLYVRLYENTHSHPACLADQTGWRSTSTFLIFLSEAQVKVRTQQYDNYDTVFFKDWGGARRKKKRVTLPL